MGYIIRNNVYWKAPRYVFNMGELSRLLHRNRLHFNFNSTVVQAVLDARVEQPPRGSMNCHNLLTHHVTKLDSLPCVMLHTSISCAFRVSTLLITIFPYLPDTSEQDPLPASTLNSHTPCQLTLYSRRLLRPSEFYPASPFTQLGIERALHVHTITINEVPITPFTGSAQLRQPSSPTAPGCITPTPVNLLPFLHGHQFRLDASEFSDKRSRCTT
ncbi:uncharacterized protein BJ212DRAFT_888688 [Suillus subaureus]|uniref:Uncharacterized protein n=1 Tax=Suillus subaureus TaxID=48587 RepID=A0A9P7DW58_9AGAM|nr:uncharacterized protein BJ212DRAFT_888688 [Suillus subaureus]KAG1804486.1 hypothetical protein BJ212DRAFT_888688 [Suillus subaureus]